MNNTYIQFRWFALNYMTQVYKTRQLSLLHTSKIFFRNSSTSRVDDPPEIMFLDASQSFILHSSSNILNRNHNKIRSIELVRWSVLARFPLTPCRTSRRCVWSYRMISNKISKLPTNLFQTSKNCHLIKIEKHNPTYGGYDHLNYSNRKKF